MQRQTLQFKQEELEKLFEFLINSQIPTESLDREIDSAGGITTYTNKIYGVICSSEWPKCLDNKNHYKLTINCNNGKLFARIVIQCVANSPFEGFVRDFNARYNPNLASATREAAL